MRSTYVASVASLAAVVALTSAASAGVYVDASHDLFDNGFANLDITSVTLDQAMREDGDVDLTFTVTTRGMSDWTKYMIFVGVPGSSGGPTTNPWGRPVNTSGQELFGFVGAWIDGGSGGMQVWGDEQGTGWSLGYNSTPTINWGANSVSMTVVFPGMEAGGWNFVFDVATSGGGSGDPGVDHLSRSDMATSGWGTASVAGQFATFTLIPAPGAVALLGMAGALTGSRRRR